MAAEPCGVRPCYSPARASPARSRSAPTATPVPGAEAEVLPDGAFRLDVPAGLTGVAPGQSAVLYDGDAVLCGGFIVSAS